MTNTEFFTDSKKFETVTNLLQQSVIGGVVTDSSLTEEQESILQTAVSELESVTKDERYCCRGCDKVWSPKNTPDTCMCGTTQPENPTADSVTYYCKDMKSFLTTHLPENTPGVSEGGHNFQLVFDSGEFEEVTIGDLNTESTEPRIHISPYYQFETGEVMKMVPGFRHDYFLCWNEIPKIITGELTFEEAISNQ